MTGYNFENYDEVNDLPPTPEALRNLILDKLKDEEFVSNRELRQHIGEQEQVELSEKSIRTLLSEVLNWMEEQGEAEFKERGTNSRFLINLLKRKRISTRIRSLKA
jgi:hypothetical protein